MVSFVRPPHVLRVGLIEERGALTTQFALTRWDTASEFVKLRNPSRSSNPSVTLMVSFVRPPHVLRVGLIEERGALTTQLTLVGRWDTASEFARNRIGIRPSTGCENACQALACFWETWPYCVVAPLSESSKNYDKFPMTVSARIESASAIFDLLLKVLG
jgi:hypothetical protein